MATSLPTLYPSSTQPIRLTPEPLTPASFAPFGTAITSPFPSIPKGTKAPLNLSSPPRPAHPDHQTQAIFANQKSALKTAPISTCENRYPDISDLNHAYKTPDATIATSHPLMSMFTCFPRQLDQGGKYFAVKILERHPCTTQTFIPLGLAPSSAKRSAKTRFLVIVAPSLPVSSSSSMTDETLVPKEPAIQSAPDLANIKAFIAEGNMAVTYGVGTWHAPMAVLGEEKVDFVVMQFVDGTSRDCEEVLVGGEIGVDVSSLGFPERDDGLWKSKGQRRKKNGREGKAKL